MQSHSDSIFQALADPHRRRVVQLLGERPRRAGELAAETRLSSPAMSRHLRVLREAGVIRDERAAEDARMRVFRLNPVGQVLRGWLSELEGHWADQLASFDRHVERGVRE
jgi:DNA-binding transcriptional ArsR family regulator